MRIRRREDGGFGDRRGSVGLGILIALAFPLGLTLGGCAPPAGPRFYDDVALVDRPPGLGSRDEALSFGGGANGKKVLYLNFEGADLKAGFDDAGTNVSGLVTSNTTVPAFVATPFLTS